MNIKSIMDKVFKTNSEEQQQPSIKVVGKIDLDAESAPRIPTVEMTRAEVREKLDNWQPKKWQDVTKRGNIQRYSDGDILEFQTCTGKHGIAIGCLDPINRWIGFYIAVNMYGDGVVTKKGDVLPDGTMAGEWTSDVKNVQKASVHAHSIAKAFLLPQIENERTLFREVLVDEYIDLIAEQRRIMEEEAKRKEEEARLAEEKRIREMTCEAEANPVIDEDSPLCKTETIDSLHHLDYVRGAKTPEANEWPRILTTGRERSYYYNLIGRVNFTMERIRTTEDDQVPIMNYVLSPAYFAEMMSHCDEYTHRYDTFVSAMKHEGESGAGSLSWVSPHGIRQTVIYYVHYEDSLHWQLIYLEDDDLILHQLFTKRSGIGNDYNQVLRASDSTIYVNYREVINRLLSILLCFFGMEAETKPSRIVQSSQSPIPHPSSAGAEAPTALPADVCIRTAAWYTQCTVVASEVAPYESHRWKGSGENKTLEPVTVSGYTKGSYTRRAQCAQ